MLWHYEWNMKCATIIELCTFFYVWHIGHFADINKLTAKNTIFGTHVVCILGLNILNSFILHVLCTNTDGAHRNIWFSGFEEQFW